MLIISINTHEVTAIVHYYYKLIYFPDSKLVLYSFYCRLTHSSIIVRFNDVEFRAVIN